ncbi:MAG TPA: hypothetical protein VFH47_08960 [Candidatus Thermoplasmatota archaeon]|nr:hypothetical protein [Candidatus Thermoplasmatota archaeon]
MADLSFAHVLIVSVVACVGLTLVAFWYSGLMVRKDWSYQVRAKPRKGRQKGDADGPGRGDA